MTGNTNIGMTTWQIFWHDDDGKDYRDVIRHDQITSNGTIVHEIVGPKGGVSTGKANVSRKGKTVELDYEPFPQNATKNLALGTLRLQFSDDDLTDTPIASWRDQGKSNFSRLVATAYPISNKFIEIFDDAGQQVYARFSIDSTASGLAITMDSRGGTVGQTTERNKGYALGLRLMLRRLATGSLLATDALLTSRPALKASPDAGGRRLSPKGYVFPVELSKVETDSFAAALQRAQSKTLSDSKTGGNTTRRFTLQLKTTLHRADAETLVALGHATISSEDIEEATKDFDPNTPGSIKKRVERSIAERRGQEKFRTSLLAAYSNKCAMTGCRDTPVLEAAHIAPYIDEQTNHIQNGLLLRADIHTLFDLYLIGIDVETWKVVVSKRLTDPAYLKLHGIDVRLPSIKSKMPNVIALQAQLRTLRLKDP